MVVRVERWSDPWLGPVVRPSPEALRGTSLEMPGSDRGPPYLPEHAYKANQKSV